MRKIFFMILIAVILIVLSEPAISQVQLKINVNSQPVWGPVGYDAVEYYYMPDIETYYYVPQHQFIYLEKGKWKKSSSLPNRYSTYNLFKGYKVVINEDRPYNRNKDYRAKYISYKNNHDQHSIRDSRDSKYYSNKNHPEHNNWVKKQKYNKDDNKNKDHQNNGNKNRKK